MILILSRLLVAVLVFATARCGYAEDGQLRRRADLGAAIAAPEGGKPARIVRFRPESVLEKAGLRIGDRIVAVDARPVTDATAFGTILRGLRAGDVVRIDARRNNEILAVDIRVPPMREEAIKGLVVRYGGRKASAAIECEPIRRGPLRRAAGYRWWCSSRGYHVMQSKLPLDHEPMAGRRCSTS